MYGYATTEPPPVRQLTSIGQAILKHLPMQVTLSPMTSSMEGAWTQPLGR